MTLTEKLLKIDELIHAKGGVGFIYIRAALEDVEKEAEQNNPLAIQFIKEVEHVMQFCEAIVKKAQ